MKRRTVFGSDRCTHILSEVVDVRVLLALVEHTRASIRIQDLESGHMSNHIRSMCDGHPCGLVTPLHHKLNEDIAAQDPLT